MLVCKNWGVAGGSCGRGAHRGGNDGPEAGYGPEPRLVHGKKNVGTDGRAAACPGGRPSVLPDPPT